MSTKTTLKRIALVAVSALGFGLMTAVAPANATPATVTSIVVGTVPQGRVGVTSAIPFKIYISGMTAGDTLNINAEITSAINFTNEFLLAALTQQPRTVTKGAKSPD